MTSAGEITPAQMAPKPPVFVPEGRCTVCKLAQREVIERGIKRGLSFVTVTRIAHDNGADISRQSILRHYEHASERLDAEKRYELRTVTTNTKDLAILVRDMTADAIADGTLMVGDPNWRNVTPGLKAQQLLDQRDQRRDFNKTQLAIAALLSGGVRPEGIAGLPDRLLLGDGDIIDAVYTEVP